MRGLHAVHLVEVHSLSLNFEPSIFLAYTTQPKSFLVRIPDSDRESASLNASAWITDAEHLHTIFRCGEYFIKTDI